MKKILCASIGNCVHVAGINNFLAMARRHGYQTVHLGSAVPIEELVVAIERHGPDIVGISYHLNAEGCRPLFERLEKAVSDRGLDGLVYLFDGTPPVVEVAKETGLFLRLFDGNESPMEVESFLSGTEAKGDVIPPQTLIERIGHRNPYPLIRHNFGLPSVGSTLEGARRIAESGVLDILSIDQDQNCQECFFRPHEMDNSLDGMGGSPFRSIEELEEMNHVTRTGNHPLLRCHSGTRDLLYWAELSMTTIGNCFGAAPLCWYSELDMQSRRPLKRAMEENKAAMYWYGANELPLEVNESHQWALRDCGDAIEVATAFLGAYNAKEAGVKDYIQQFMFNAPRHTSPSMDLAKMSAKLELLSKLEGDDFRVFRMVRTGLAFLSPDPRKAKGQLASSVATAMMLRPHIVHVVGHSEGDHASTAEEVIESCLIAKGVIDHALLGQTEPLSDPVVEKRKDVLVEDAGLILEAIRAIAETSVDPWTDPRNLIKAIRLGILDAPHLKGCSEARGDIVTMMIDGACVAVDDHGRPLRERERLSAILSQNAYDPPGR